MKRIKMTFKKMPKKVVAFTMLAIMVFASIASITKVLAAGEHTYTLTFTFNANNQDEHTMTVDNGTLVIDGAYISLKDGENNIGTAECNQDNTECTITVTDGPAGNLNYNGTGKFTLYMQGHPVSFDFSFENNETIAIQDYEDPGEPGHGGENESHFDGRAYVLWSCGSGTCYHLFENIPPFDDGNSTFYEDAAVIADNDNSKHFDVHAEYKAWALPEKFVRWVNAYIEKHNIENPDDIDWSHVDPEDIIAEFPPDMREWEDAAVAAYDNNHDEGCQRPGNNASGDDWNDFQNCVDDYYIEAGNLPFIRLQPVGEPSANNAYVSYGDRNFKVVIYNSAYKGLTLGDLSQLDYYPAHWTNPFLRRDQYDISGTTKNNPTKLDSILLEDTVVLRPIGLPGNTLEIDSIEPLDVPAGAVNAQYKNNEWKIEFESNFYDNVVFKVTDTTNHEYYIKIQRYTVDAYLNYIWDESPEDQHPAITAEFYYERNKNYDDFELTAKIIYKDGTIETVPLTAIKYVDDGLGNITQAYQVDQEEDHYDDSNKLLPKGKGLNKSVFRYNLQPGEDRTIRNIYINVEKVGSTTDNYAGAYTGSGEGVKVKMGVDD